MGTVKITFILQDLQRFVGTKGRHGYPLSLSSMPGNVSIREWKLNTCMDYINSRFVNFSCFALAEALRHVLSQAISPLCLRQNFLHCIPSEPFWEMVKIIRLIGWCPLFWHGCSLWLLGHLENLANYMSQSFANEPSSWMKGHAIVHIQAFNSFLFILYSLSN